jgi:uncharacterized membrane protein YidH (DUF202 family)
MSFFYQILIGGILLLALGIYWLYNAIKYPYKTKEPYDLQISNLIRAISLIIFGIIFMISLLFMTKFK